MLNYTTIADSPTLEREARRVGHQQSASPDARTNALNHPFARPIHDLVVEHEARAVLDNPFNRNLATNVLQHLDERDLANLRQVSTFTRNAVDRQRPRAPRPPVTGIPPAIRGQYDPSKVVKAPTKDSNGTDLRWAGQVDGGRNWQKRWKQVGHGRPVARWDDEGPAEPPQLRTKSPQPKYRDEDKKFGWRKAANPGITTSEDSDVMTTRYERDEDNALAQGRLGGSPGVHGFVQDSQGSFHLFDDNRFDVKQGDADWKSQQGYPAGGVRQWVEGGTRIRNTHHTTPVEGSPVASAGMTQTNYQNRAEYVSDQSGHYIPEGEYTAQGVRAIRANMGFQGGVGKYRRQVRLGGYDHGRGQGKHWIGENSEFAGGALELPAEALLESTGNERQMRLKATLNQRIRDRGETGEHVPSQGAIEQIWKIRQAKKAQEERERRKREQEELQRREAAARRERDPGDARRQQLVDENLLYNTPYDDQLNPTPYDAPYGAAVSDLEESDEGSE